MRAGISAETNTDKLYQLNSFLKRLAADVDWESSPSPFSAQFQDAPLKIPTDKAHTLSLREQRSILRPLVIFTRLPAGEDFGGELSY